jgi:hypothetical protein
MLLAIPLPRRSNQKKPGLGSSVAQTRREGRGGVMRWDILLPTAARRAHQLALHYTITPAGRTRHPWLRLAIFQQPPPDLF